MKNIQKLGQIKALSIALLLFIASPDHAVAYGGHGYHHGYGSHYSHHDHIGAAGYVVLGLLGIVVLSQILDNDNDRDRHYRESKTYRQPTYNQPGSYKPPTQPRRVLIDDKSKAKPAYAYGDNEAWEWLAKGNAGYALDIFAIQSQQNLNSGIPKIGFAIAAAANGDKDRATRAMRKAIRVDAAALDMINVNNIKPTLKTLSENYQLSLNTNKNNTDDAFMIATLSYLQQDYATANDMLAENDQSQSANKLRKLIVEKEG